MGVHIDPTPGCSLHIANSLPEMVSNRVANRIAKTTCGNPFASWSDPAIANFSIATIRLLQESIRLQ